MIWHEIDKNTEYTPQGKNSFCYKYYIILIVSYINYMKWFALQNLKAIVLQTICTYFHTNYIFKVISPTLLQQGSYVLDVCLCSQ